MGRSRVLVTCTTALSVLALGGCAWIERSSVRSDPPAGESHEASRDPSLSQTGRYVAFTSPSASLVNGDTNVVDDVFVRDHVGGLTQRVSVATGGAPGGGGSRDAAISDDGRFVAFETDATNLFSGDGDARSDIVVRDRQLGTTTVASIAPNGSPITDDAIDPAISGNGRFVAFSVNVPVFGFCCARLGPYVRDLVTGTTVVMFSRGLDSGVVSGAPPSLSDDGSRIAYGWVVPPSDPTQERADAAAVVGNTATGAVVATVHSTVLGLGGEGTHFEVVISGDGTEVAYVLASSISQFGSLFHFDLEHPGLVPVLQNLPSPGNPALSDDGSVLALRRGSTYVVTNVSGAPPRVVSADAGGRAAATLDGRSDLSGDGRWVSFASSDRVLVPDDNNRVSDVFVRSVFFSTTGPS